MEGEEKQGEEGVGGDREAEGKRGGLGGRDRRGMRVGEGQGLFLDSMRRTEHSMYETTIW